MTVQKKLYGTTGALAVIGVIVAASGSYYLHKVDAELDVAMLQTAPKLDLVGALRAHNWEALASLRGVFMFANLKNSAALEAAARQADAAVTRMREIITDIRPLLVSEEGRRNLAAVETTTTELQSLAADYVRLCREGKLEQLNAEVIPKVRGLVERADASLESLKTQQRQFFKDSQAQSKSLKQQSTIVTIIMFCLLLAVVVAAVIVMRRISRTLISATVELSEAVAQIASGASQVSSSSQSLAQASSEQASALEETSSAAEEINALSRKNGDSSRVAADSVTASQQKFEEANRALNEAVTSMAEINAQSDKISKIIKTIDEIAFQTNILALNAAVEAARAGEAGMGFAVVADEVRNLAQRCAEAAKDTSDLIEESIRKSNVGKVKVDQVAAVLGALTGEAVKVKTLVEEVYLGAQDQVRGIEQISKAIIQMQQVTQQTAAGAEEGASAAEELHAQAQLLNDLTKRLTAMVGEAGMSNDADRYDSSGHKAAQQNARTPEPLSPRKALGNSTNPIWRNAAIKRQPLDRAVTLLDEGSCSDF